MAVVRRALTGTIVGIFGIAAALGVSYPAAATSAKGHHAPCAKASKSRVKHAKRGAKCRKARKPTHDQTEGRPRQTPAEADARELLGSCRCRKGGLKSPPSPASMVPLKGSDAGRWRMYTATGRCRANQKPSFSGSRVTLRPDRVFRRAAKAARPKPASRNGGVRSNSPSMNHDVKSPEQLVFEAIAAEGGGTALRADAQVIPADATCVRYRLSTHEGRALRRTLRFSATRPRNPGRSAGGS